jgi:xanthine dehydrogenase/oxidase
MVLGEDERCAELALAQIKIDYEELPAIFDPEDADAREMWYVPQRKIENGDVDKAFAEATYIMEGKTSNCGQEHFYMDAQRARQYHSKAIASCYTAPLRAIWKCKK